MIYIFFIKKTVLLADNLLQVLVLTMKLNKLKNLHMNFINQLLENLTKENSIHHLETMFGMLI